MCLQNYVERSAKASGAPVGPAVARAPLTQQLPYLSDGKFYESSAFPSFASHSLQSNSCTTELFAITRFPLRNRPGLNDSVVFPKRINFDPSLSFVVSRRFRRPVPFPLSHDLALPTLSFAVSVLIWYCGNSVWSESSRNREPWGALYH